MQKVLEELHSKYVPFQGNDEHRKYATQALVGDQLSCERAANVLVQLENGFTSQERLDGLHVEIADFHGGMKFLQVCKSILLCYINSYKVTYKH